MSTFKYKIVPIKKKKKIQDKNVIKKFIYYIIHVISITITDTSVWKYFVIKLVVILVFFVRLYQIYVWHASICIYIYIYIKWNGINEIWKWIKFFHCHCSQSEGSEMSFGAEDGGCKCGSNCTCDPCNCKWAKMDKEAFVAVKL